MARHSSPIDWRARVRSRLTLEGVDPLEASRIEEEVAALLAETYEQARRTGADQSTAEERASERLGDWQELAEGTRDALPPRAVGHDRHERLARGGRMSTLLGPLKPLRSLRRNPASSIATVLVLTLGLGSVATLAALVWAMLLRPLPYPQPERLGLITIDAFGRTRFPRITPSNLLDFSDQSKTIELFGRFTTRNLALELPSGELEWVPSAVVDDPIFEMMGLEPLLGELPNHVDHVAEGQATAVAIGEGLWRRRFSADPQVLGRGITIEDRRHQVIGVIPESVRLLLDYRGRQQVDLWVPREPVTERGTVYRHRVAVRLGPGASFEVAAGELRDIARRGNEIDFAGTEEGVESYGVIPIEEVLGEELAPQLRILAAAVGCVLLLVAANAAILLVLRARRRSHELAVRRALGAASLRIGLESVAESTALTLVGALLGLLAAILAVRALPERYPGSLPRVDDLAIGIVPMAVTLVIALVLGLLVGLVPVLLHRGTSVSSALGGARRTLSPRDRRRGTKGLVALEVAIAATLLLLTGLLLRTFESRMEVELGFEAEGVLSLRVPLHSEIRQEDRGVLEFDRRMLERLSGIPGVRSAALTNNLPLTGGQNVASYAYDEPSLDRFGELSFSARRVTPGFFETLRIPLLEGRVFQPSDSDTDNHVVIVARDLAESAWPGESALGKRVWIDFQTPDGLTEIRPSEVVGVVGPIREVDLHSDQLSQIYLPYWEATYGQELLVRTEGDPMALAPTVRQVIEEELGSGRPVAGARPLADNVTAATRELRFFMTVVGTFSGLALLLAAVGMFGLVPHTVSERRPELGLRLALGATRGRVCGLVFGEGLRPVSLGVAVGVAAAFGLGRVLAKAVPDVASTNLPAVAATVVAIVGAAFLACAQPARSATRVDPATTLRSD